MEDPRRGFLYWAGLPDDPPGQRRPVLVVSIDPRNRFAHDVLIVPLSTRQRVAATHVALRKREAGLPRPSVAKCEQVTTLRKDCLVHPALGGPLAPARMAEIERAILVAIGALVVPPPPEAGAD